MRHSNARCEAPWCKRHIRLGANAVRIYGRLWHVECAIRYRAARKQAREPVGV
jgi:hypothetical protein